MPNTTRRNTLTLQRIAQLFASTTIRATPHTKLVLRAATLVRDSDTVEPVAQNGIIGNLFDYVER